MNPVQRPLENVFKHPPIIMDLAVTKNRKRTKKIPHLTCLLRRVSRRILVIKQLHPVVGGIIRIAGDVSTPPSVISRRVKPPQSVILVHSPLLPSSAR